MVENFFLSVSGVEHIVNGADFCSIGSYICGRGFFCVTSVITNLIEPDIPLCEIVQYLTAVLIILENFSS